ncbi:MAG TPA: potassium-transporting ATPase subunit KdpA [Rubricoccaceae bacterium]
MNPLGWLQIALYLAALIALAWPVGVYMARVLEGRAPMPLRVVLGPVERLFYRLAGVRPEAEQTWKGYALAVLVFNAVGMLAVYAVQRLQGGLPLNPMDLGGVTPDSAFNTAASFASNTNWQGYGGEVTMSYLSQMLGLTVQNFLSAATGIAVLVALIRGITRRETRELGNFWVDLTRSTLYILLPMSLVLAVVLVGSGVVQTFDAYQTVELVQPGVDADGAAVTVQTVAVGPAASQVAIKQLGTNGGGFFNTNSAHPLENPTPLSNWLQMMAILLLPAGLCVTFGKMVGNNRQGWALFAAMFVALAPLMFATAAFESGTTPGIEAASQVDAAGNMEGKEVRFGVANSAIWATATTAASNGSVNAMHDSFTPLGGLVPMFLMQLGEVIFGGVGSGLYGMLVFAIIAVFVAGLMVGRTPEFMGKKIEAFEMKMAAVVILAPCLAVLAFTAIAVATEAGRATVYNPGAHGFSEVLYAFTSMGNNNGSAFAGLGANNPFYNSTGGLAMLISRFWIVVPVLAIAGSLAGKRFTPPSAGTLPTASPLFVAMLLGVVVVVGALTFVPALALGPIAEHLQMTAGR